MRSAGDYALIGDMRTAALLDRRATLVWWCAPRFDSSAVFASLLGDDTNGSWALTPAGNARFRRSYSPGTLVLETVVEAAGGCARITDFMVVDTEQPTIVRLVDGVTGAVEFTMRLAPRMHYGQHKPVARRTSEGWVAYRGPDAVCLRATTELVDDDGVCRSTFVIREGQRAAFALQWFPANSPSAPPACNVDAALAHTRADWQLWTAGLRCTGPWRESIERSAIMLRALTDRDTGGVVAAVTTSLPERTGGEKNWDYRYCWLRDAGFISASFARVGRQAEVRAFRDWFMRVYGDDPSQLHIMYGSAGERLTPEYTLPWLSGFNGSRPVRVRNGAHDQFQLGVLAHVLRCFTAGARAGVVFDRADVERLLPIRKYLADAWRRPGNGIWETRGSRRQYVDSKVMAWSALVELDALAALAGERSKPDTVAQLEATIRDEVERAGFDPQRRTFTQYYGSAELDASILLMPLTGFLPATDARVRDTVATLERELSRDGFLFRYSSDIAGSSDESFEGEGAFIACGFWLVEVLVQAGRLDAASRLFERLAATANDVGIFSEEYDVERGVSLGNVPQGLSHSGLIDAAVALSRVSAGIPAE